MQSGRIEQLQIQRQKGFPFERVPSVIVEAGNGILGDCHCTGGEKQITLISHETIGWLEEQELPGLCFSRFQGNVVTKGINYTQLSVGNVLNSEAATLEIIQYSKRCFPECRRIQEKLSCELSKGIAYAKVIQSGKLQEGDCIWSNEKG